MFIGIASLPVSAQKKNAAYQLHIHKTNSPIKIDGVIDDSAWQNLEVAGNFYMVLPMDSSHARVRTEVMMTYDEKNIYIAAICYLPKPGRYMVESLRRDFVFGKNDNFLLFMDTYDDQTNGFSFGANAAGAQWDGTMYEGGKVDLSWENKWQSSVKNYPDKWVWEAAFPFKTLRYKKGIKEWGVNFSRLDIKMAEKSAWAPVPRQFPTASLAYSGTLVWDEPPPTAGPNISLIPYALGKMTRDFNTKDGTKYQTEFGGDAKIAVSSALNLDLTVNPDFSQVEVDQQVTNLNRYELFFPEKRQFFLENGDQFSNFGYPAIRPFFSRRIGLNAPIRFGARMSGKLDKNWRMGIMDMQTGAVDSVSLPAENFAVVALQRKVFARSNLGFIFINKQAIDYDPSIDSNKTVYSKYNRNLGLEYNLASSNNLWTGKALFIKSFSPNKKGDDYTFAGHLQYASRKWMIFWENEHVGKNFVAETGYVPRVGYIKTNPLITRLFFPRGGPVLSHGPTFSSVYFFDESFHRTDNESILAYNVAFRNQATFSISGTNDYVKLLQPFDPTNTGKDSLAKGTIHQWNSAAISFISKPQRLFTYSFSTSYGGYYADGTKLTISSILGYRFQPFVSIQIAGSYNDLHLPQPWGVNHFWLVGPRIDITFTNTLFFTTFVQYNNQLHNLNINTRFQWRYRPASDLFIVYTDNYYPTPFSVKNRAIVLKLNYWLNL